ncbi:MAG: glutamate synthase subunit beta, partial [Gammaproteobacteria bacterium]
MDKLTAFIEIKRQDPQQQTVAERTQHYDEFSIPLSDGTVSTQAARCMDCGIPYCHQGCPVNNVIPAWNDLVYNAQWQEASDNLHATNNFPEFTGRICPAPCEAACTLNLNAEAVTIKTIECAIVDKAWQEGWIKPQKPKQLSGKQIAIVGSGPAGLACAQQLARMGHTVIIYEKNAEIGGLLRYGIPDFKMNKALIDRRIAQMQAEGVEFVPNTQVGRDVTHEELLANFNAIVLAGGAEQARDLAIPGNDSQGIHFAMQFLTQQNKRIANEPIAEDQIITAKNKHVIIIGGGDTGSDCIGTATRQGALEITQLEVMPQPPLQENKLLTWPHWPLKLRTSSSQAEGCEREWAVLTKSFSSKDNQVSALNYTRVKWVEQADGQQQMVEDDSTEYQIKA